METNASDELCQQTGQKDTGKGTNKWQARREGRDGLGVASKQGLFIIPGLLCVGCHVLPVLVTLVTVLFNREDSLKKDFD